jgi:DNA-binding response OmpR family regulator
MFTDIAGKGTNEHMTTDATPRILLIEDDRYQRRANEAVLRKRGFDVRTAADGQEGLDAALRDPPDIILLDLILPKLNGLGVLKKLKQSDTTRDVPVIVFSNLGQESDIRQATEGGAVGYLIKSDMTLAEFVAHVEAALAARPAS